MNFILNPVIDRKRESQSSVHAARAAIAWPLRHQEKREAPSAIRSYRARQLTQQFNFGQTRAILAGGQAVVMHGLAMMSKDGNWVLCESEETCAHVLNILSGYEATYRFGAPLDVRWLSGGWSAHLEFMWEGIRVRTDFVTRPPRLDEDALARLWRHAAVTPIPFAPPAELAEMKKTVREKDYAVIGELARLLDDPESQLLYSRSARDILDLSARHSCLAATLAKRRPALQAIAGGRYALEEALDRERRQLMRADEDRLYAYMTAASAWADAWPETQRLIAGLPLKQAHERIVGRANGLLPEKCGAPL